ncbi:SGNH/GDSL hydrolase family protein [Nitrospira sp. M1]
MNGKTKRGKARLKLILAAVFVSVLILVVVLETAVRVRQWVKYGTATTSVQSFTVDQETGLRVPKPGSTTGRIQVNSLGFRSPELQMPKPAGTVRLAFLGGSTTWCAEVSGNEMTWPHLVWKDLQQSYPEVTFDYLNAAVPGYSVGESLLTLEHRVKSLSPDIIVIYHATNDLSYITRKLARAQGIFSGRTEDPSWLAQWSLTWFLIEKNLELHERQNKAKAGTAQLVFHSAEIATEFSEELEPLVQASQSVAQLVALATFSHKFRKEQALDEQLQAMNTSIYYMPYMTPQGLFEAFDAYNGVIRETAQTHDILLIGGENRIPGDDRHFNDSVHFKDAGSQAMAVRVTETLKQAPQFQTLLKKIPPSSASH